MIKTWNFTITSRKTGIGFLWAGLMILLYGKHEVELYKKLPDKPLGASQDPLSERLNGVLQEASQRYRWALNSMKDEAEALAYAKVMRAIEAAVEVADRVEV